MSRKIGVSLLFLIAFLSSPAKAQVEDCDPDSTSMQAVLLNSCAGKDTQAPTQLKRIGKLIEQAFNESSVADGQRVECEEFKAAIQRQETTAQASARPASRIALIQSSAEKIRSPELQRCVKAKILQPLTALYPTEGAACVDAIRKIEAASHALQTQCTKTAEVTPALNPTDALKEKETHLAGSKRESTVKYKGLPADETKPSSLDRKPAGSARYDGP
jgi:hypothetical protein